MRHSFQEVLEASARRPQGPAAFWDGAISAAYPCVLEGPARLALFEAVRVRDWPGLIEAIRSRPSLANSVVERASLASPLHYAVEQGAPTDVVEALVEWGAWRTLRNGRLERAVDVARRAGRLHLLALLEPVLMRHVPLEILQLLEDNLHSLILKRARGLVVDHRLRLPQLEPLLELSVPRMSFMVPCMYGGFGFTLESIGSLAWLSCHNGSRVVGGSDQAHIIGAWGIALVAEFPEQWVPVDPDSKDGPSRFRIVNVRYPWGRPPVGPASVAV